MIAWIEARNAFVDTELIMEGDGEDASIDESNSRVRVIRACILIKSEKEGYEFPNQTGSQSVNDSPRLIVASAEFSLYTGVLQQKQSIATAESAGSTGKFTTIHKSRENPQVIKEMMSETVLQWILLTDYISTDFDSSEHSINVADYGFNQG